MKSLSIKRLGLATGLFGSVCGVLLYSLNKSVKAYVPTIEIPSYPWEFNRHIRSFDHKTLRRGWQVYRTVCSSCHSLRFVRFQDLVGVTHTEEEVKAIAEEYEVEDGPDEEGNYFMRPGKLSDLIPKPYANEEAARAANNGAFPVDLTYAVYGKRNGINYIFSLLTGYVEPPAGVEMVPGKSFNVYFSGGTIGMPQMVADGVVEYDDGTPASQSQIAKDIVEFLMWTANPEFDTRKLMGLKAIGVFAILLISSVQIMRSKWSLLKSQKIAYVPKR